MKSGVNKRDRWIALSRAADALPPPAREAAVAMLIGGLALALANAVDIAWSVPWPEGGLAARAWHHFFDALETLSLAAWLALPFALAARWPILSRERAQWGWLALTLFTTLAMYSILERHLVRQAHAAIEGIPFILLPVYVTLVGLAVPAAFYLTGFAVRVPGGWIVTLVLGTGGIVLGHAIMRDDYPGVHAAIAWVSAVVFGGSLAPKALAWIGRSARRREGVVVVATLTALTGALFHPPNAVRLVLFRQPGAVASWVYAQTLWARPALTATRPAPLLEEVPEAVLERSLRGVPEDPVVVLVTVDALRADALANAENAARFPNLTRLRQRGAHFTRAVACGSQTSVSLTSMFASRYFSQMRWQNHGYGRMRFLYAAEDPSVRFPELLSEAGVATHSFVPIVFLSDSFGIVRGFANETQVVKDRRHAAAREVMVPLLKRLEEHDGGRAFFYVHLMEPHEPYNRGKLTEGSDWEKYLSEIEIVDDWIGRLERTMRRRFKKNGYILVSADHGEAFGEHGTKFHTKTLYDELLHVPLILWGPGVRRRTIDAPVSLIDVGPTLLHTFRQPLPETYQGRSLWPLVRGQLDAPPRPIFAEGRLRQAMYTADGLKVIEDTVRRITEVYDLKADPGELRNLFDLDPARAHPAVAEMRAFFNEKTLIKDGYDPPFKP